MEPCRIWLNPGKAWFLYHRRDCSKAVLLYLIDHDHMHTISNDRCDNGVIIWKQQQEVKERSLSSKLSTFSSDGDYCIESRCKSKIPPLLTYYGENLSTGHIQTLKTQSSILCLLSLKQNSSVTFLFVFFNYNNSVSSNNDITAGRLWYCYVVRISWFKCWTEGSDRVAELPRTLCTVNEINQYLCTFQV